ncbi:MAG: 3-deoxy-8-phosphooctulonate synthase [Planctomycetota bacterium]|nr:3-deoxy-8-phosphooctulonate synthase [Planctomycetota bacterium]
MVMKMKVGNTTITDGKLFLIAGPCVIESEKLLFKIAETIIKIAHQNNIPFILKSSYDKANRLSYKSYRGVGLKKGLKILSRIKNALKIPVLSDIHCKEEIKPAAEVLDVIQIPALLCRQTDLLINVGKTGRAINIKKGQFLAPTDMIHLVEKVRSTGNNKIIITERGTSFGYHNLVSDMRSIAIMKRFGYPVVYDASHSAQLPGAGGGKSAGQREMIPVLARAAVAAGADGVFLEVHPQPNKALCDGHNSLPLTALPSLIATLVRISRVCGSTILSFPGRWLS